MTGILAVARHTLKDLRRKKIWLMVPLFALALWLSLQLGDEGFAAGLGEDAYRPLKIVYAHAFFLMPLLLLLATIFTACPAIPREIEGRQLHTLFAKPLARSDYLAGKMLGFALLLAGLTAAMGAITLAFLLATAAGEDIRLLPADRPLAADQVQLHSTDDRARVVPRHPDNVLVWRFAGLDNTRNYAARIVLPVQWSARQDPPPLGTTWPLRLSANRPGGEPPLPLGPAPLAYRIRVNCPRCGVQIEVSDQADLGRIVPCPEPNCPGQLTIPLVPTRQNESFLRASTGLFALPAAAIDGNGMAEITVSGLERDVLAGFTLCRLYAPLVMPSHVLPTIDSPATIPAREHWLSLAGRAWVGQRQTAATKLFFVFDGVRRRDFPAGGNVNAEIKVMYGVSSTARDFVVRQANGRVLAERHKVRERDRSALTLPASILPETPGRLVLELRLAEPAAPAPTATPDPTAARDPFAIPAQLFHFNRESLLLFRRPAPAAWTLAKALTLVWGKAVLVAGLILGASCALSASLSFFFGAALAVLDLLAGFLTMPGMEIGSEGLGWVYTMQQIAFKIIPPLHRFSPVGRLEQNFDLPWNQISHEALLPLVLFLAGAFLVGSLLIRTKELP